MFSPKLPLPRTLRRVPVTAAVLLAGVVSLALLLQGRPSQGQPPPAQTPPATETPVTLLDQGLEWDARMRALYHYTPQGSRLMPRAWFTALERPSDRTAFIDPENLRQYGLIHGDNDAGTRLNPNGLPIGFGSSCRRLALHRTPLTGFSRG